MPQFGPASLQRLATCDERLQRVFEKVVQDLDCSVIEGHRDQAAQDKAFAEGHSKLKWPHGNHNALPSRAADVAPYPIDWNDSPRMHLFAGRSEEHTSELQSLMRISYADFCLQQKHQSIVSHSYPTLNTESMSPTSCS